MTYRVFVSEGKPHELPEWAAMVIDADDYVFVVGDSELDRIPADDVRDIEVVEPRSEAVPPLDVTTREVA